MRIRSFVLFVAIAAISCSPVRKFSKLPEVTAWENDIQKFEQLDTAEWYPENSILFTGSSSIRLWSTLAADMKPYNVIQRGYGGAKLSDFVVYADRIISPHPCSAIVIFIANDITGSDTDKTPEEVSELFRVLLKIIRKSHPETPVFWISVTPTPSRWKAWPQIREAGRMIRETCKSGKNTYFIDTEMAFLDQNGLPAAGYFVSDMLHLNEKGYEVWKNIIKSEVNKVVPYPPVKIIAHRGASYLAPENTVAAAKLAWQLRADAVECDIHLSADNRVVVSHDANTKRTSGKDFEIRNTNSSELRILDAGSFKDEKYKGEKIPFLEELIETVPEGKELVIEIKCGPEVIPFLKDILNRQGKAKKFSFIAFDFNTICKAKEAFPAMKCYWLCSNTDLLNTNLALVRGKGLDGVSLSYNIISNRLARQITDLGIELYTWTVDDAAKAKELAGMGISGITSNRPDYIREVLGY